MMNCVECGKKIIGKNREKFCSRKCSVRYHTRKYRERHNDELLEKHRKYPPISQIKSFCLNCGEEFTPTSQFHPQQKFCSRRCRNNFNRRHYYWQNPEKEREKARKHPISRDREEKTCIFCGKKFKPLSLYHPQQKYCRSICCIKFNRRVQYQRHRKRDIEYLKKYRGTEKGKRVHRDGVRASSWARRKTIEQMDYRLTPKEFQYIRERDNSQCQWCGSTKKITFDHIIPIRNRGLDIIDNVVIACKKCNTSRQNKDPFEWCDSQGIVVPKKILELLEKQIKDRRIKINVNMVPTSLYEIRKSLGKIVKTKMCVRCGKSFRTTNIKKEYCSPKCRGRVQYEKESKKIGRVNIKGTIRTCPTCNKKFEIKSHNQIYCRIKCKKPRTIICKSCGEEKEIYGLNMCRSCWKKEWRLKKIEGS